MERYRDSGGFLRATDGDDGRGPLVTEERDDQRQRIDYYDPGDATQHVRYIGVAPQGTADSDPSWSIRRYGHASYGGTIKIDDVQVLTGAWDQRASLNWS